MLTIHKQTVMVHPIVDKYFERDPYHIRSSAFVQAKGLTSNEKTRSDSASPAALDRLQPDLDGYRKLMSGTLPFGSSRSLSPDLTRRSRTPASMREAITPISPSQISLPTSSNNKVVPAQGNIKVKRRTAQLLDNTPDLDPGSDSDEPMRSDGANQRKLSQLFPELVLGPSAGPQAARV